MPALLKAFLEQTLRPGFAFRDGAGPGGGLLKGRSARLVVTMGMPALFFRLWYLAASVMVMRRNILHFVGVRPVRATLIGGAGALGPAQVAAWRERLHALGARGG
jgi:putative NADPH-quinone reductase